MHALFATHTHTPSFFCLVVCSPRCCSAGMVDCYINLMYSKLASMLHRNSLIDSLIDWSTAASRYPHVRLRPSPPWRRCTIVRQRNVPRRQWLGTRRWSCTYQGMQMGSSASDKRIFTKKIKHCCDPKMHISFQELESSICASVAVVQTKPSAGPNVAKYRLLFTANLWCLCPASCASSGTRTMIYWSIHL